ncbi:MAG: peptidylprolyl isomerase [Pseudomonadota bacterium]|nr:peptidylprolyl isomerase [Pseudomonadota bacterium]
MKLRIFWWLFCLTLAVPVHAVYQELDGIVAIVEEDVILASELRARYQQIVKQLRAQKVQVPPNEILLSQLVERLIIESLQRQEAERRGVDIDDETLTRAVLSFAEQSNMTLEQFEAALLEDGTSYREFREDIRNEIMISRLQRNLINRRITISEQDVQGLLNSPFYKEMFSDEYRVGHILLSIETGASESAVLAAAARGTKIVEELRGGADFANMAIENSSSSRALEGGDLGLRKAAELPSLFAETVLDMEVGEIAEPIQTSGAVHIIKLLERKGAGTQREKQTLVRHILVRSSEIRSEEETVALIESIYDEIVAGADFAELAERHSEDPASALNGGSLGWSATASFVPQFAEVMEGTEQGGTSAPFHSQFGWHVLQVLDRREEDMSDEARESMAMEILHRRRFEEEQQEWLKELRDEAFVEIRM